MFLFWYYIHIPIKNIMSLRGMRKAKDSCELETFQKRAILFYKIGKWLKHKIKLKDKPERENLKNLCVGQIFHEVAGILIFEISNLLDSEPQLFFTDFFRRVAPAWLFFKNARVARRVVNCSAHTQYMSANLRWLPEVLVFFCFSYPRVARAGQKKVYPRLL